MEPPQYNEGFLVFKSESILPIHAAPQELQYGGQT